MTAKIIRALVVADVKCYHCGHISGQIFGARNQPLKVSDFTPRPGYTGPELKPGMKLRCERCQGPVFFEDATSGLPVTRRTTRQVEASRQAA